MTWKMTQLTLSLWCSVLTCSVLQDPPLRPGLCDTEWASQHQDTWPWLASFSLAVFYSTVAQPATVHKGLMPSEALLASSLSLCYDQQCYAPLLPGSSYSASAKYDAACYELGSQKCTASKRHWFWSVDFHHPTQQRWWYDTPALEASSYLHFIQWCKPTDSQLTMSDSQLVS